MDIRKRVNWRFGLATVAVAVGGGAFAVWRNGEVDRQARANFYAEFGDEPSRTVVVAILVVTALVVAGLVWWWRDSLRRLDGQLMGATSPADQLEKLAALRQFGALSEEEFTAAKSRTLGECSGESRVGGQ